jgi:uncharacterized caspase-like protein
MAKIWRHQASAVISLVALFWFLGSSAVTQELKEQPTMLHVLAIGINHFTDRSTELSLKYAVKDAGDFALALQSTQKRINADFTIQYLTDDKANRQSILAAMGQVTENMRENKSKKNVAFILLSSHGAVIGQNFYLIPYDFNFKDLDDFAKTAISGEDLAYAISSMSRYGKVVLLVDACFSGALRHVMAMDNVSLLTSSKDEDELSREDPTFNHGAFTEAFLESLAGGADPEGTGTISMLGLASSMSHKLRILTQGKQQLGLSVNYDDDILVTTH